MALSVRPERRRAMVAHLLPNLACARRMVSSSSAVKGRCSTCGDSWLHHRRRHDLPERPGMDRLMRDQLRAPWRATRRCRASSSSGLQGPLIRSTSDLPPLPRQDGEDDAMLYSRLVLSIGARGLVRRSMMI
uniref:Uncharacterized protein n=1 Tax=Zea mays TaxID=4577 RepID=C4J4G7_MAIZE|nr:unknown [Zea mays]